MYSKDYIVKASLEKIALNQVISRFEYINKHKCVLSNEGLAQELRTIEAMLIDAGFFDKVKKWVMSIAIGSSILLAPAANGFYLENPKNIGVSIEKKLNSGSSSLKRNFEVKVKTYKDKTSNQVIDFVVSDSKGNKLVLQHNHESSFGSTNYNLDLKYQGDSKDDTQFRAIGEGLTDSFKKVLDVSVDEMMDSLKDDSDSIGADQKLLDSISESVSDLESTDSPDRQDLKKVKKNLEDLKKSINKKDNSSEKRKIETEMNDMFDMLNDM